MTRKYMRWKRRYSRPLKIARKTARDNERFLAMLPAVMQAMWEQTLNPAIVDARTLGRVERRLLEFNGNPA